MEKLKNNKIIKILPMAMAAIVLVMQLWQDVSFAIKKPMYAIGIVIEISIYSIIFITTFIYFLFEFLGKKQFEGKCKKWLAISYEVMSLYFLLELVINFTSFVEYKKVALILQYCICAISYGIISYYLDKKFNNLESKVNNKVFAIAEIAIAVITIIDFNFNNLILALFYIVNIPYFYTYENKDEINTEKANKIDYKEKIKYQIKTKIIYSAIALISLILMFVPTYGWDYGYGYTSTGSSFLFFKNTLVTLVLFFLVFSTICIWKNRKKEGIVFSILYSISLIYFNILYSSLEGGYKVFLPGILNGIIAIILNIPYYMFIKEKEKEKEIEIAKTNKIKVFTDKNLIVSAFSMLIAIVVDCCISLPNWYFPVFIIAMIFGLIWAYLGRYIGIKKNIYSGYIWGYFLGIIGFIVMCALPANKETKNNKVQVQSNAEEIGKYKTLLDTGAITQEEYDKKKKELLNL